MMSIFGHVRTTGGSFTDDVADARSTANNAQLKVAELEERIDKLTLVCYAMWDLLREKSGVTEEDLVSRVAILDAADGEADGKISKKVRPCVHCGRPVASRHQQCLYCGVSQPANTVFKTL